MSPVTVLTGASRGIGQAIAERLAGEGHTLINLSRSRPGEGFSGISYSVDLGDADAVKRTVHEVNSRYAVDNLSTMPDWLRSPILNKSKWMNSIA